MRTMMGFGVASLLLNFLAIGCRSETPVPPPKEFVNLPVYTAAQGISADSQEKYMSNPTLRAYAIGRYIDPATKTVMHEEHSIYRLVRSPEWNLIPQPDAEPLRHPELSMQERYAEAMVGQLSRTMAEMDAARKEIAELLDRQREGDTSVETLQAQLDELNRKYSTIVENLIKTTKYVNELESKLSIPGGNQSAVEGK